MQLIVIYIFANICNKNIKNYDITLGGFYMTSSMAGLNLWLSEKLSEGEEYKYLITNTIYQNATAHHNISFVELENRGIAYVLDNKLQFTSSDEFMFYEPLVHVPLIHAQNVSHVLILGYGCGASLREVLKWKSVKSITLVESDKDLLEAGIKNLKSIHNDTHTNQKVNIILQDIEVFLQCEESKYNVIICDISAFYREKKDKNKLNKSFFTKCHSLLKDNGVLSVQVSDVKITKDIQLFDNVKLLKSIFKTAKIYSTWIPSICKNLSFLILGKSKRYQKFVKGEIEIILKEELLEELKFINANSYIGLMNPPKYLQDYEIAS